MREKEKMEPDAAGEAEAQIHLRAVHRDASRRPSAPSDRLDSSTLRIDETSARSDYEDAPLALQAVLLEEGAR